MASAACSAAPVSERHVVAHAIAGCRLSEEATLLVTALGDFGGARATGTVGAKSSGTLDLRPDLVGVEAEQLPRGFRGIGYADPPDDVALTLWSSDDACDATDAEILPSVGGQALTTLDRGRTLFVAGLMPAPETNVCADGSQICPGDRNWAAYALSFDLTTGAAAPAVALAGLPRPRAFASATPFGDGVLVAGGVDPNDPKDPLDDLVADTAFVFSEGRFENGAIELGDARAHHGAVALANGQTLLVGGIGKGTGEVLSSMEAVDPLTRNSRFFQVARLAHARRDPVVLRLASDDIFVGAGTDASGAPVGTVEWFGADGSPCVRSICSAELAPVFDRAFAPLPSGAVLTAGGFDLALRQPVLEVGWIRADGQVEMLMPLSSEQRGTGKLRLVAASNGAAWLFNGRAWWMFDPWQAVFVTPDVTPGDGPDDDMPDPLAVDPGLFVWLARQAPGDSKSYSRVRGFRHGVRGPYTRDVGFLLLGDAEHWVPDRVARAGGDVELDATGLRLANGARAVLADTSYRDFVLSAATPSGSLPKIQLGDVVVGEGACFWPALRGNAIAVTRRGASLDMSVDGTTQRGCAGPSERVAIGLRAPDEGSTVVTKFSIQRL